MTAPGQPRAPKRIDAVRAAGRRATERAQRLRWAPTVTEALERERHAAAALLAGGVAYRLFFWLVAFGLFIAAGASFWVRSDEGSLVDAAKSFGLPGVAAQSAASAVHDGERARWYFLVAGVVLMAYFGLGAVRAFRIAAFVAWRMPPTRLRRPGRATAAFTLLVVLAFGVTLAASWVRHHSPALGVVAMFGGVPAYAVIALAAFVVLPRTAASTWRSLLPGAVLVGCGLTAIHLVVVYYLSWKLEHSPKLYGTLGASTVVLLALFLIARVGVAGLFLNATLHRPQAPDPRGDGAAGAPGEAGVAATPGREPGSR